MVENKRDLTEIVIEAINEKRKPLDLVVTYILWKNGEMKEEDLKKELQLFIDSLTANILDEMIDELIEFGYLGKDEDGKIYKKSE